jgi:hypothetical protein
MAVTQLDQQFADRELRMLPLTLIDYPRKEIVMRYDKELPEGEEMQDLISSTKNMNVISGVSVRPKGNGRYEMIAGSRRLRAAHAAGIREIPATVYNNIDNQHARMLAFSENKHRRGEGTMSNAKLIAKMYESIGISLLEAIKILDQLHHQKHRSGTVTVPNAFDETFKNIGISAIGQRTLLGFLQLPKKVVEEIEEKKVPWGKIELLTKEELKKNPDIQKTLVEEIAPKKVTRKQAKQKVEQAVHDIKTGYIKKDEKSGGYVQGLGGREYVTNKPEIDSEFDIKVQVDFRKLLHNTIAKLIDRKLKSGELSYEPNIYGPKLDEFKEKLESVNKKKLQWLSLDAQVLMRICKAIVDTAR